MAMRKQFCDAFDALQEDAGVRAVILTGTGGDFCSGADIGEMGETPPEDFVGRMHRLHRMARSIASFRAPVIAAVDGVCIGAAWGFALAADIVLATPETRFSASFRKIGYAPDAGLTWHFLRQMGAMRAKEIIYTGRIVTGVEAFDLSLALELAPQGGLMDRAMEIAQETHRGPSQLYELSATPAPPGNVLLCLLRFQCREEGEGFFHRLHARDGKGRLLLDVKMADARRIGRREDARPVLLAGTDFRRVHL